MWRGFTLDQVMDQCFSNRHDPAHGRQMPVHYGSKDLNFQFISSPLATQMPQGMPWVVMYVHITHLNAKELCLLSPRLCLWPQAGWLRQLCYCVLRRRSSTGRRLACSNELCSYPKVSCDFLLVCCHTHPCP